MGHAHHAPRTAGWYFFPSSPCHVLSRPISYRRSYGVMSCKSTHMYIWQRPINSWQGKHDKGYHPGISGKHFQYFFFTSSPLVVALRVSSFLFGAFYTKTVQNLWNHKQIVKVSQQHIKFKNWHVLCADFSMYYVQILACLMWIAVQTGSPFGSLGSLCSLASVHVESTCEISSILSLVPDSPNHPTCLPDRARRLPDMSPYQASGKLSEQYDLWVRACRRFFPITRIWITSDWIDHV